jgi:ankyrin repeat protein
MTRCLTAIRFTAFMLLLGGLVFIAWTSSQSMSADEFCQAARKGDLAALERGVDQGIPINCRDGYGLTPLMEAARAGGPEALAAARFLIEHGADVEARAPIYGTALTLAARNSQLQILKLLLAHHASPNPPREAREFAMPPLIAAAISSEHAEEMVRALLDAGSDPKARSVSGWTALQASIDSDNKAAMKVIQARLRFDHPKRVTLDSTSTGSASPVSAPLAPKALSTSPSRVKNRSLPERP